MIGLMEYKFMTPVTGSDEEKELALLFETLLEELRQGIQENYNEIAPLLSAAPPLDRTVPARQTETGEPIRIIRVATAVDLPEDTVLPSQTVEEIINKFDDIAVGHCFCRQRRQLLADSIFIDAALCWQRG